MQNPSVKLSVALVGNPNVGKSALFNQLTGLVQKTGNYPGVTVTSKSGTLKGHESIEIVDLPGVQNLTPESPEEAVVLKELLMLKQPFDLVVYVANSANLHPGMLLYTQLADLGIPMALVLNMADLAHSKEIEIDEIGLGNALGVSLFPTNAHSGKGVQQLIEFLSQGNFDKPNAIMRSLYETQNWLTSDGTNTYSDFLKLVNQKDPAPNDSQELGDRDTSSIKFNRSVALKDDIIKRYARINQLLPEFVKKTTQASSLTSKIDRWIVHPVWGYLIFCGLLLLVFQAIFSWSSWPMDLIDGAMSQLSVMVKNHLPPGSISDIITQGVIPGIGGIVIFIPQIALLFFFITILEASGYMSRTIFLLDRIMRFFGLDGKSVVPLVSGAACAIPAIMAARTIKSPHERLITILVVPFMTCAARLPVYTILIALIVPTTASIGFMNAQGVLLMGMYALGTLTAVVSAMILSRFLPESEMSPLAHEMPTYKIPDWRNVIRVIADKTWSFVWGAGRIIFAVSILLWLLTTYGLKSNDQSFAQDNGLIIGKVELEKSFAGQLGHGIEPILQPLGYDWKIGIALITSFAAREVFVGTIATIYSVGDEADEGTIKSRMRQELVPETGQPRYTMAVCLSLLLFYAFSMQCMSTVAIVKRETGSWKWAIGQAIAMTGMGYISALAAFQMLA